MASKITNFFDNPWEEDGGNNGSSNGGEPRKPQKKIQKSDDLDVLFSKFKKNFQNRSPDFKGGKGVLFAILGVISLWLLTGFYTVQPDQQALILRFGEYHRTTGPGLHYRLPMPIEKLAKVRVTKVNSIEVGYRSLGNSNITPRTEESLMLTGDENIVDINFEVQWRIKDAYNFLFNVRDFAPGATVKSAAESAMREVIGKNDIALILAEGRSEIEIETKGLLQETLDFYKAGIEIVRLQLLKVDPPQQVIDAFRDVQTAKLDKERAINQADAYSKDIIPRARGEAQKIIEEAKAYSNQVVADAKGRGERFISLYSEYAKAPSVTRKRMYLDTLEEVLGKAQVTVIDGNASKTGVMPYLPLNEKRIK